MRFADLHIHSFFSDGIFSPRQLLEMAKKENIYCVSLTDHDSVGGYLNKEEGLDYLETEVEIIPGIELTTEYSSQEIHILGYFIDYKDPCFLEKLEFLRQKRTLRIKEMIKRLNALHVDIDFEEIADTKSQSLTRLHLAKAMVKRGIVGSILEAFQKYIGEGKPAYVGTSHFNSIEAIKLVQNIKGLAVLAHPYSINNFEEICATFIEVGLRGLEVYYPEHSPSLIDYYQGFAQTHGLLITGGSDFHGDSYKKAEMIKIPYILIERLKEERCRNISTL